MISSGIEGRIEGEVYFVGSRRYLEEKGIRLTGDNRKTAEAVRRKLGIPEVIAEVLPGEKEAKVREQKEQGMR